MRSAAKKWILFTAWHLRGRLIKFFALSRSLPRGKIHKRASKKSEILTNARVKRRVPDARAAESAAFVKRRAARRVTGRDEVRCAVR